MLKIVSIVIRVDDLASQARFWSEALDYVERDPREDDWVVLKPRDADAPCIALDAHRSERILPPRIHLDIYADDQSAEIRRLTGLGAREVPWDRRPENADYVIMEDPEGNRFCIVERPDWPGWVSIGAEAARA
ncbi:VOC family protein [Microbacterium sp. NPDC089318]